MRVRVFQIILVFMVTLSSPPTSYADWRSDIGIFRIGVVTGSQSVDFLARAEPFRLAISEALEMEVEFFAARNTEAAIDAIRTDRIEYAILSASAYAVAWHGCECVEPIAMPRSADSTDGYHAILIAREGGPKKLSELAGKKIAKLSPDSMSQSVLFKQSLKDQNINLAAFEFIEDVSGEQALASFIDGQFDALLGWSSMSGNPTDGYSRGTLRQIVKAQQGQANGFKVIWKSKQLPHKTHLVRRKLPGETKNILRNLLLGMFDRNPIAYDSIEPVYGGGFTSARQGRFQPLIELLEKHKSPDALNASAETEAREKQPDAQN